jgi:hypothetical protein
MPNLSDKLNQKESSKNWNPKFEPFFVKFEWQNDHLYGLFIDQKIYFCYFISKMVPNSDILYIWKTYLTLEIVKQDKCPANYCLQNIMVASKILFPHLHLIDTCSTFPCQHALVVSSFALSNPSVVSFYPCFTVYRYNS